MSHHDTCAHKIIEDYIDIDPDRSRQVFYCEKCFATFSHKEYHQYTLYDKSEKTLVENVQAGEPPITLEAPDAFPPRV